MNKKPIKPKTFRQCLLMPCFANEDGKCICLNDLKKDEKPYNYTDYKCPFFKMNVNDGAKEIIVKEEIYDDIIYKRWLKERGLDYEYE